MLNKQKINKILVMRLSSLGDVILTTPVFTNLRQNLPEAYIAVLTKEEYATVLKNNPNINEIISFNPQDQSLMDLVKLINGKKFDLVLDLHRNLRTSIISLFIKAKVIKYDKQSLPRYLLIWFKIKSPSLNKTIIERYLESLINLGITSSIKEPKIYLTKEEKKIAFDLLIKYGLSTREVIVGLNPGAKWETKRWPKEYWAQLIDYLAQVNCQMIVFGDNNDLDFVEKIFTLIKTKPKIINFVGKTDLRLLASLIENCTTLITGDSGPMHLACALGVPVIALFGPTVAEFGFVPQTEQNVVLQKELSCRPCSLHGTNSCPKKHFLCLKSISAEEVKVTLVAQLKKRGITLVQ